MNIYIKDIISHCKTINYDVSNIQNCFGDSQKMKIHDLFKKQTMSSMDMGVCLDSIKTTNKVKRNIKIGILKLFRHHITDVYRPSQCWYKDDDNDKKYHHEKDYWYYLVTNAHISTFQGKLEGMEAGVKVLIKKKPVMSEVYKNIPLTQSYIKINVWRMVVDVQAKVQPMTYYVYNSLKVLNSEFRLTSWAHSNDVYGCVDDLCENILRSTIQQAVSDYI